MRITFQVPGVEPVEGEIQCAEQRCKGIVGFDEDSEIIRCRATRHAHRVDPWECGHDFAEGVIVGTTDDGAHIEVCFDLNEQWSPMLFRMGL